MPQPPRGPITPVLENMFSVMSAKLVQEVRETIEEQHRLLISSQEACLASLVSEMVSKTPRAAPVLQGTLCPPPEATPQPSAVTVPAEDPTGTKSVRSSMNLQQDHPPLLDQLVEAGVSGRGATWIAGVDRMSFHHKEKHNLHHKTGICITVVNSWQFHLISMVMICINAVYIGVDADWNDADKFYDASLGFQVCEQIFCAFFTVELFIRFGALKYKRNFVKDRWICLDIFTVTLMVTETWIYPNLLYFLDVSSPQTGPIGGLGRMLRLSRLARISKLFEMFPELVTMVKGMVAGIRSVHAALVIMSLLVYVFAIIMNVFIGDVPDVKHLFGTVRGSMVTLLLNGVLLDDVSTLTRTLIHVANIPAIILLAIFILLSALTVMNMVIGVLCEVVIDVSAEEKESHAKQKMQKTLYVMLQELDADNSGQLSKEEVQSVIKLPEAVAIMNDIQVDTQYLLDVSEMLFTHPDATLPISIFMNIVLTLRGRREPTINDMAKNHNMIMFALETQSAHQRADLTECLEQLQAESGKMRAAIVSELEVLESARRNLPSSGN